MAIKRKMVGSGYFDATGSTVVMVGSDGDDQIVGNHLDNRINAKGGDDIVVAARGNDRVLAGDGDDAVAAGSGRDRASGGDGDDYILGNQGHDRLRGDAGDDWLEGGRGNDILRGGDGDDSLEGGTGNDKLYGDAGTDVLEGGAGADALTGGADADVFVWTDAAHTNGDAVLDFTQGEDVLDLSGIGGLSFIGDVAFSGVAGELRADFAAGVGSLIQGDLDGDGTADFTLAVADAGPLLAGDFIL